MANRYPAGFPKALVPWMEPNGLPTRDFLYLQQALWNRTGAASGEFGATGAAGPAGPAVVLASEESDEPMMRAGLLEPGGWFDEKGSGGTPGFASGVDFTAGVTTMLMLSQPYGAAANLIVTFDSGWQGADQFTLSGKTLAFTSPIPVGVEKVYVKGFLMPR